MLITHMLQAQALSLGGNARTCTSRFSPEPNTPLPCALVAEGIGASRSPRLGSARLAWVWLEARVQHSLTLHDQSWASWTHSWRGLWEEGWRAPALDIVAEGLGEVWHLNWGKGQSPLGEGASRKEEQDLGRGLRAQGQRTVGSNPDHWGKAIQSLHDSADLSLNRG